MKKNRQIEGARPFPEHNGTPDSENKKLAAAGRLEYHSDSFAKAMADPIRELDWLIAEMKAGRKRLASAESKIKDIPGLARKADAEFAAMRASGKYSDEQLVYWRSEVPSQRKLVDGKRAVHREIEELATLWRKTSTLRAIVANEIRKDVDLHRHTSKTFEGNLDNAYNVDFAIQTLEAWRTAWARGRGKNGAAIDPRRG